MEIVVIVERGSHNFAVINIFSLFPRDQNLFFVVFYIKMRYHLIYSLLYFSTFGTYKNVKTGRACST